MATLETILGAVQDSLQDNVFTTDKLTKLANQCIDHISTRILLPHLETADVVSTIAGTYEVAVPTAWSFARNMYACFCLANKDTPIQVLNSIDNLMEFYPDYKTELLEGHIEYVVKRGDFLTYYPIPEVVELQCNFYRQPTPLVNDADVPYTLPYGTHEDLLENFILWKAWAELEDGLEGPKTNTQYYLELFMRAFDELDSSIDYGQSRNRPVIRNGWI